MERENPLITSPNMAVVLATGACFRQERETENQPDCLLPVVDRPMLQHVVEALAREGLTEIHFILSHLPEHIEEFLGDGTRWGCHFSFHLARLPEQPYGVVKALARLQPGERFLLAHAQTLPAASFNSHAEGHGPVLFCEDSPDQAVSWTGWGWMQFSDLQELNATADRASLEAFLLERDGVRVMVSNVLSVHSYGDLLVAQRAVLAGDFPLLLVTGREHLGVRACYNAQVHRQAQLVPPVFLGENCQIGAGAVVGPNVVVGNDCVVDVGADLENTLVFAHTYVGAHQEFSKTVVRRNEVIHADLAVSHLVAEPFALSGMQGPTFKVVFRSSITRLAATILLILSAPCIALTALWLRLVRPGPVIHRRTVVKQPASDYAFRWQTFNMISFCPDGNSPGVRPGAVASWEDLFLRILPALIHVVRGELKFVGMTPRNPQELEALPTPWLRLCLPSPAGLIPVSVAHYGALATEDQKFAAEAYYSARPHAVIHLLLLWNHTRRMMNLRAQTAAIPELESSALTAKS